MQTRQFRDVMGRFASGITVITTCTDDGQDHGMTASAFSSVSLEPPLVLVCVGHAAHAHRHIATARKFAVNILSQTQIELSDRFANRVQTANGYDVWPDSKDKFEGLAIERSGLGCALLSDTLGSLDCALYGTFEGGDHTIYIGKVAAIETSALDRQPLLFFAGRYAQLAE